MKLDLPEEHRRLVLELLAKHLPGVEVRAYGSRVTGAGHEGSDLDLVVCARESLPAKALLHLRAAMNESALPMEVEIFDWRALPRSFQEEIEREHVVLQSGDGAR